MDAYLEHLATQRAKLQKQISKLQGELEKLDYSERQYRSFGAASHTPAKVEEYSAAMVEADLLGPRHFDGGTIKQRVVRILEGTPQGLTSGQILMNLKTSGLPDLARESLSPQLTRLKRAGEIDLDPVTSLWTRVQKHETPGA